MSTVVYQRQCAESPLGNGSDRQSVPPSRRRRTAIRHMSWHPCSVIAIAISCLVSTAFGATPNKRQIVSLDGPKWLIAIDSENVGRESGWHSHSPENAKEVKVPCVIQEHFPTYRGVTWYWTKTSFPSNRNTNGRSLLRFWSVGYKADVWLNGVFLGQHEGGDTPFVLDATHAIKPDSENLIAVRVVDPAEEGTDGFVRSQIPGGNVFVHGGILDSVELLFLPSVYVRDVYVKPDPSTGVIVVQATVNNCSSRTAQANFQFALTPIESVQTQVAKSLPPGESTVAVELVATDPHLWSLNDPFLYTVAVSLSDEETESDDEVSVRCGFRDFRIKDGYFQLNGRRLLLRAAHTGQQDPVGLHIPTSNPDGPIEDLRMMKEMGFNAIRFLQMLGRRSQLEWADENGFLILEEPRGGWLLDYVPEEYERRRDNVIREMILRDRNHPSVVMWGLLNESPWGLELNHPIFAHAKGALKLVRELDDTRLVLLSSGRWDCDPSVGSVANPGSWEWQCLLGKEHPDASPIVPYCQPGGRWPAPPATPIAGFVGDQMGDVHIYPRVPHTAAVVKFLQHVGCDGNHTFVSEYGVSSAFDLVRTWELYEACQSSHLKPAQDIKKRLDLFLDDWDRWEMSKCFGHPRDFFRACLIGNAQQRLVGLNALRSNPNIIGISQTATVDTLNAGEGMVTLFREEKPGLAPAIADGLAPLRWCLFVEPLNVYRGSTLSVDIHIANEDALPVGRHGARVEIVNSSESVVFSKDVEVTVEDNVLSPLAWKVFANQIEAAWPAGKYRLRASFAEGRPSAAGEVEFFVADATDLPEIKSVVTTWNSDEKLEHWLMKHGVEVDSYSHGRHEAERQIIVAADKPAEPGGVAAFNELLKRIENGATVIFLDPGIFADGADPVAMVPLQSKGTPANELDTSCVYPKDVWAKNHPIFNGMPAGGLLDPVYYREIFTNRLWQNQDMPNEAVAGAIATSSGYYSGLQLAVYERGKGKFIINMFHVVENLDKDPSADRLLLNMINYMASLQDYH